MQKTVVTGNVNGGPYRAHFQGTVTEEDKRFLEEVIAAAIKKAEADAK